MKTDELISMLATGIAPIDRHVIARRFCITVLLGAAGAVLIVSTLLGVRADLAEAAVAPIFWAKVALPLVMTAGALVASMRLARPGAAPGSGWLWISAPVAAVCLATLYLLINAPAGARLSMMLGQSWRVCPFNIAMLSIPSFISVFWALRGLAPTRLALTGAVGGLLAGSTAALAYCLHCPEMSIPFWGVWYLPGMLVPAAVGAALGPRLLRW
jgi:hypothetical protein